MDWFQQNFPESELTILQSVGRVVIHALRACKSNTLVRGAGKKYDGVGMHTEYI